MKEWDVIVVGAGLSGAVLAERFARVENKRVLVLEQRSHIAGNCYDYTTEHGVTVHKYGPHLFHTNNKDVWKYLSAFTSWTPYEHKVLGSVLGKLVPIPFNLTTLHELFDEKDACHLEETLKAQYGEGGKVPVLELRKSSNRSLRKLGEFVYEKFFKNYTAKQWACSPEEISPSVTARVPVIISRDDRYFQDEYQAIPSGGYTHMVSNILDHSNIDVHLNVDATSLLKMNVKSRTVFYRDQKFDGTLVFTGMLDQLFGYDAGELPYRSLQFEFESLDQSEFQPATTINYPNDHAYTRITEFKYILSQNTKKTTIVKEYPQDYDRHDSNKNIPYYPILNDENAGRYEKYKNLADCFPSLITAGRLADYRYYNMDDAVGNALKIFDNFSLREFDEAC